MLKDPLRRTGYFFRTDDDIDFTPSEYSYFRRKEDLESFVEWFDHVQESYLIAGLDPKEDHNFIKRLYLIKENYKKFFDHLCDFDKELDPVPIIKTSRKVNLFPDR